MEALDKGRDWLQAAVDDAKRQEVRQLAQAAGLQVSRSVRSDYAWLPVAELREALVNHLQPQVMGVLKDVYQTCCGTAAKSIVVLETFGMCMFHCSIP